MSGISNKTNNIANSCYDLNVLLASGDEKCQAHLSKILYQLGCKVTTVNNGLDSINQLLISPFDLLIADTEMQPISGFKVAKKVRKGISNIDKKIIIIGLVEEENQNLRVKALEVGMNNVINPQSSACTIASLIEKYFDADSPCPPNNLQPSKEKSLDDALAASYIGKDQKATQEFRVKYISRNLPLIDELGRAIVEKDNDAIFHITHKLKSSSLFIGAKKLHILCKEAESLSKQKEVCQSIKNKVFDDVIREFKHLTSMIN